jgi:hypothetical protein
MTALCVFALWRSFSGPSPASLPLTVFLVLIGVAMLWATAYFVASIIRPPVILEATPQGILTYLDLRSHRYVDHSQLIAWQTILHIDYYKAVTIMSEGPSGLIRVDTARLQLKPGHGLPIDDLSILTRLSFPRPDGGDNTGIDWENTIFLDATTGVGTPQYLAQQLEDLRQASGKTL